MPTTPTSPDAKVKKTPPPVANKPSRQRSSLLSIISNQRTSASDFSEEKEVLSPSTSVEACEGAPQCTSTTTVNDVEKENVMPPPPSEELLAQISAEDGGMEDMDFPPPPDEIQIQEALDRINSKYETSQTALAINKDLNEIDEPPPLPPVEPTLDSDEVNAASKDESVNSIKLANSNDEPVNSIKLANFNDEPDLKSSDKIIGEDSVTSNGCINDQVDNSSVVVAKDNDINLMLNSSITAEEPKSTDEISANMNPAMCDASPVSNGIATPPLEDVSPSSNHDSDTEVMSLDDKLSTDSVVIEEDHMTVLPVNSSFSALDTDDQPEEPLDPAPDVNGTHELNHNVQNDKASRVSNSTVTNTQTNSVAAHTSSHPSNNTSSSESGDSGIYSLVGETIQVQLRPVKNDNKKPDYSVPMFERNSNELKRVTFQESQQIMPAVIERSAKEQERIKRTGLSEDDVAQTELFYKGHKTEVMVCPCLATLYFAESVSSESVGLDDWKPEHIGIPVLIYDTGDGKRSRGLTMVFAEKGTGFSLWKTVINYESRWEIVEKVFHRLRIAGTNDKLAGIAYQDAASAESFYQYFKDCTSDPELNVLNNPNIKLKKKKEKQKSVKKSSIKLPRKMDISLPCQFTHITQLKQSEEGILAMNMVDDESASSEDGTVISK